MHDLSGKTILVTGASSGIGAATARVLAARGARLVVHYAGDATARAGAEDATGPLPPDRRTVIGADFADQDAAARLWRDALAWAGRIDAVVLNAAITRMSGGIEDSDEAWREAWDAQWRINVLAPCDLMRLAVHHWLATGGGILVTMASWNAQRGSTSPAQLSYAATKAAVKAAAQTIARGYANRGILSYIVSLGIVRTKMSEDFAAIQGGEDKVTATLAMGEWVPPAELGELIAFLCSGACRHLTGATLDVNGATYVR
jgi:NAD(P)-dependent dehydrogenase (short-subunit alcohol dehydrogenase family)